MKRSTHTGNKRGFSTIAGGLIILSLVVLFTVTFVAVESTYHSYSALRDSLENRKRAESFFLLSSSVRGDFIVVFNGGSNLLHIVSVYINHILTASVSVYIEPKQSQPVLTFTTMLTGDLITVVSDLGNRISVLFPVVGPSASSFLQNKYVGTGPLAITFANWSFLYQPEPSGACSPPANQTAWPGIPRSTNDPIFFVALINHARGNITLLDSSVMNFQVISEPRQDVNGYFIIGSGSNACQTNRYSSRPPYFIPENPFGDIASGGQPVMVAFGAGGIDSTSDGPDIWNLANGVAAAFLSLVYVWHTVDAQGNPRNEVYSQDIPFAALRICTPVGGICT